MGRFRNMPFYRRYRCTFVLIYLGVARVIRNSLQWAAVRESSSARNKRTYPPFWNSGAVKMHSSRLIRPYENSMVAIVAYLLGVATQRMSQRPNAAARSLQGDISPNRNGCAGCKRACKTAAIKDAPCILLPYNTAIFNNRIRSVGPVVSRALFATLRPVGEISSTLSD